MDMIALIAVVTVLNLIVTSVLIVEVYTRSRRGSSAPRRNFSSDRDSEPQLEQLRTDIATTSQAIQTMHQGLHELLNFHQNAQVQQFETLRTTLTHEAQQQRNDLSATRQELSTTLTTNLEGFSQQFDRLRADNEQRLEKMRLTVDEKLQGTLEKRLGDSFQIVSERLELVQRGLGEMHTLASDVGGLKRVLMNVKSRGTWGEVQLSRQLEDMLAPDQYDINVAINEHTNDRVEFAVRLPGRNDDQVVYLPIDSKFPNEDYERLLHAQELADATAIELAGKSLEQAIRTQAKTIADKYIDPPRSTDFAIMYLPTEGLFAEVIRRPGLASELQRTHRIMLTGPTTLMAMLNSLQMGFKTLAIEKRSSEVWQILSAAKTEFRKYGDVWDRLDKQLATAQRTVQAAGQRTRAVERRLRGVESLELPTTEQDQLLNEIFPYEEFEPVDPEMTDDVPPS